MVSCLRGLILIWLLVRKHTDEMQLEACGQTRGANGDEILREIEQEIIERAQIPMSVFPGVADGTLCLPQVPEIRFIKMLGSGCFGKSN